MAAYLAVVTDTRDEWHAKDREKDASQGEEPELPVEFWFRGQARAEWGLTPRLYRPSMKHADEVEIQSEFKRRGQQLTVETHLPTDVKEWYFLMQHYGAPTRLLDWTDGALLGLYFALRLQDRPSDAAVWMLDPEWLNAKTFKRIDKEHSSVWGVLLPEFSESARWFPVPFEESLLVTEPAAIDPPHVARRVAVQRSHFTVHGTDRSGLESWARGRDARLVKITIPQRAVEGIRTDLTTCGITETTVFPDLEALSRELERKWRRM